MAAGDLSPSSQAFEIGPLGCGHVLNPLNCFFGKVAGASHA